MGGTTRVGRDAGYAIRAAPFDISLPAFSRHLKVLERASLIVKVREGQHRRSRLDP